MSASHNNFLRARLSEIFWRKVSSRMRTDVSPRPCSASQPIALSSTPGQEFRFPPERVKETLHRSSAGICRVASVGSINFACMGRETDSTMA